MINLSSQVSLGYGDFLPQEELQNKERSAKRLVIGIPAEIDICEQRVPLTPQVVEILVQEGVVVLKEQYAGLRAKYTDEEYAEVGATICKSKKDVFKASILLKIGCITEEEIPLLTERQVILSTVSLPDFKANVLQAMIKKHITAIGYEFIHDFNGNYPLLRSINEISGTMSIFAAAECLSEITQGKGVLLGGITGISSTEVVILGANTAGEFAARAAIGLGANVKIFDSYIHKLVAIQQVLSQRLFTSNYHEKVLRKALVSADVVIGAIRMESEDNFIVSEDMVKSMKRGSVVVDLCMNQGGCFETSRPTNLENPIYTKHNVVHYCVPNISSRVSRTASIALSNILIPLLQDILQSGNISVFLKQNYAARQGVYLYNGILTNVCVSKHFGMSCKNMDLLSAAF